MDPTAIIGELPLVRFIRDVRRIWRVATAESTVSATITLQCDCGRRWSYTQPRQYAGSAFASKRVCPDCGKRHS